MHRTQATMADVGTNGRGSPATRDHMATGRQRAVSAPGAAPRGTASHHRPSRGATGKCASIVLEGLYKLAETVLQSRISFSGNPMESRPKVHGTPTADPALCSCWRVALWPATIMWRAVTAAGSQLQPPPHEHAHAPTPLPRPCVRACVLPCSSTSQSLSSKSFVVT